MVSITTIRKEHTYIIQTIGAWLDSLPTIRQQERKRRLDSSLLFVSRYIYTILFIYLFLVDFDSSSSSGHGSHPTQVAVVTVLLFFIQMRTTTTNDQCLR
jgi:hypothetical protein